MTFCTTIILNNTNATQVQNIASVYNFIAQGVACSSNLPYATVGWGIIITLYAIITGVALLRGLDPDASSIVGSAVGLIASLFMFGAGIVGANLLFLMLAILLVSFMVALFRGWLKPYG